MSAGAGLWRLEVIRVRDFLGFQGERTFSFPSGRCVVDAPNHTGKTSLALALLWALTGVVPSLSRINKKSFRLFNRHAGDNARTAVSLELSAGDGASMRVERAYRRGKPNLDEDLSVEVRGRSLAGEEARQALIDELGVKPGSLEGCGIVLQDHRLKLITGKDADVSDVINDMLGLYALSQLSPSLDDLRKEAQALQREVKSYREGSDPLRRWEERNDQLQDDYDTAEDAAHATGLGAEQLEDPPATARRELAAAAARLETEEPPADAALAGEIARLRERLAERRKSNPSALEIVRLEARGARLGELRETLEELAGKLRAHHELLIAEAERGEMDEEKLLAAADEAKEALARIEQRREELSEEQQFLQAAYRHLQDHPKAKRCPLCGKPAKTPELTAATRERLDVKLARELDALEQEEEVQAKRRDEAAARSAVVEDLRKEHSSIVREIRTRAGDLEELGALDSEETDVSAFVVEKNRLTLLERLEKARERLANERAEAESLLADRQAELATVEEKVHQPAQRRIDRVADVLLPLVTAQQRVEEHGALRARAEEEASELGAVEEEAATLAGHLRRTVEALNRHEEKKASEAVRSKLPSISSFFKRVAANPDYDGLDVATSISRGKVTYAIRATSSRFGNLDNPVGHVLSEGDLSAAGMGLLLGLASGESHRMGFVLLDDPAQGMDETLQENFARALAELGFDRQVIILTHQRSFAVAMKKAGARRLSWDEWVEGADA